jgi:transposase-like protein
MISWELPYDNAACPHCGSTDTTLKLQLLGLIRFTCNGCRKSFALQAGNAPATATKRTPSGSRQA